MMFGCIKYPNLLMKRPEEERDPNRRRCRAAVFDSVEDEEEERPPFDPTKPSGIFYKYDRATQSQISEPFNFERVVGRRIVTKNCPFQTRFTSNCIQEFREASDSIVRKKEDVEYYNHTVGEVQYKVIEPGTVWMYWQFEHEMKNCEGGMIDDYFVKWEEDEARAKIAHEKRAEERRIKMEKLPEATKKATEEFLALHPEYVEKMKEMQAEEVDQSSEEDEDEEDGVENVHWIDDDEKGAKAKKTREEKRERKIERALKDKTYGSFAEETAFLKKPTEAQLFEEAFVIFSDLERTQCAARKENVTDAEIRRKFNAGGLMGRFIDLARDFWEDRARDIAKRRSKTLQFGDVSSSEDESEEEVEDEDEDEDMYAWQRRILERAVDQDDDGSEHSAYSDDDELQLPRIRANGDIRIVSDPRVFHDKIVLDMRDPGGKRTPISELSTTPSALHVQSVWRKRMEEQEIANRNQIASISSQPGPSRITPIPMSALSTTPSSQSVWKIRMEQEEKANRNRMPSNSPEAGPSWITPVPRRSAQKARTCGLNKINQRVLPGGTPQMQQPAGSTMGMEGVERVNFDAEQTIASVKKEVTTGQSGEAGPSNIRTAKTKPIPYESVEQSTLRLEREKIAAEQEALFDAQLQPPSEQDLKELATYHFKDEIHQWESKQSRAVMAQLDEDIDRNFDERWTNLPGFKESWTERAQQEWDKRADEIREWRSREKAREDEPESSMNGSGMIPSGEPGSEENPIDLEDSSDDEHMQAGDGDEADDEDRSGEGGVVRMEEEEEAEQEEEIEIDGEFW